MSRHLRRAIGTTNTAAGYARYGRYCVGRSLGFYFTVHCGLLILAPTLGSRYLKCMATSHILLLKIERFRGITDIAWLSAKASNVILGGGETAKKAIFDAIALVALELHGPRLSLWIQE